MRKLTPLWRAIERIPGQIAVAEVWQRECGDEFNFLQRYLRLTDDLGSSYPCPYPRDRDCPRKIIDHGNGEYVAICRRLPKFCPDVPLSAKEALLHELDLSAFLKPVLRALSIRAESPQLRGHGVWSVGLSNRRNSLNQPVFLLVLAGTALFESAVRDLLLGVSGPFLIVAPTNRHRTVDLQARLQARGVEFLCLEEQVVVDELRGFTASDPLASADTGSPTPIADRKRVVEEFTRKYACKVKDIHHAAGVHSSDYYRWRNGSRPDHYKTCIDIERILRVGFPKTRRPVS